MIDVDEILDRMKMYNRVIIFAVAVVAVLLALWLLSNSAGRHEVGDKIAEIKTAAATFERRADAVVDATRRREVTARETARKKTADLPDDQLVAALERMLVEYRKDR